MGAPIIPNLTNAPNLGPTTVTTDQGISGGGFSVVYNTAPGAGNGTTLLPMLAIAGAGLAALYLVGRK